jgi:hypothetical protein
MSKVKVIAGGSVLKLGFVDTGEVNAAGNVNTGGGVGVYDSKTGSVLGFRGVLGKDGVDATLNATTKEIEVGLSIPRTTKSGVLIPGDFSLVSGVQKATVTFSTAFPDATYNVVLGTSAVSGKKYIADYESKTDASFVVSLGTASLSGLAEVAWQAETGGE